jgi:hypothetical protein
VHIYVELNGTSPLVMHNGQLSDPDCKFSKGIKELTDKGTNQTDVDRAEISRLEWQGGLYLENGTIVVPMANIIRTFREAAAATREGKDIARSLIPRGLNTPLIYNGPSDLNKLYTDKAFVHTSQVKVGRGRIKRTRPCFPNWSLQAEFELLDDLMNLRACELIIERAGLTTGLGDARILGFGRFNAKVAAAKLPKTKAA